MQHFQTVGLEKFLLRVVVSIHAMKMLPKKTAVFVPIDRGFVGSAIH